MQPDATVASLETASYGEMVNVLKAKRLPPTLLVAALDPVFGTSEQHRKHFICAALSVYGSGDDFRSCATEMIKWAGDRTSIERRLVLRSILETTPNCDKSLVFSTICRFPRTRATQFMKDYNAAGGDFEDILRWIQLVGRRCREEYQSAPSIASGHAILDSSDTVTISGDFRIAGNLLEDIWDGITGVVDFVLEVPGRLARQASRFLSWSLDELREFYEGLIRGGKLVVEILDEVVQTTYRASSHLIGGLLHYGIEVYELMEDAAVRSYWKLRRVVNGIVQMHKSAVEILSTVIQIAEEVGEDIWRSTITAVRFAMRAAGAGVEWIRETVEWLANQGTEIAEQFFRTWEELGAPLKDLYEAGVGLAEGVWEVVGEVTAKIGNSINYAWHFVKKDLGGVVAAFIRGVGKASGSVLDFLRWSLVETVDVAVKVVLAIKSVSFTIADMMEKIVREPSEAVEIFVSAIRAVGVTLEETFEAVVKSGVSRLVRSIVTALVNIKTSIGDILTAAWNATKGLIGTVVGILFMLLGTYRPMTREEIADAKELFGDAIDYSSVGLATEGTLHDIIFAIQDFVNDNEESRAFVTNTLINFDPKDGIKRHTLMHELTHVWQFEQDGARYMIEAVGDGAWGEGYNYGYDEPANDPHSVTIDIDYGGNQERYKRGEITGEGAQDKLKAAGGNLQAFNREQQAQILMHYFVRRVLLQYSGSDLAAWLPYKRYVAA